MINPTVLTQVSTPGWLGSSGSVSRKLPKPGLHGTAQVALAFLLGSMLVVVPTRGHHGVEMLVLAIHISRRTPA